MLNRQIDYFIGKYGRLAKFTAAELLNCSKEQAQWAGRPRFPTPFFNRAKAWFTDSP
jgi:hypothetical protein